MAAFYKSVKNGGGVEQKFRTRITDPEIIFAELDDQLTAFLVMPDCIQQKIVQQDIGQIGINRKSKTVQILVDDQVPVPDGVFQLDQFLLDKRSDVNRLGVAELLIFYLGKQQKRLV